MCNIESIIAAAGEHIRPYLSYLPGLTYLLGWIGLYVPSWVRQFYATLWIDPQHRYIHFVFRGRDYRLMSTRVREILRLQELPVRLHEICYGQTAPLDVLMAVWYLLQILSATASRSLLVKGRGETPVISLPLLVYLRPL